MSTPLLPAPTLTETHVFAFSPSTPLGKLERFSYNANKVPTSSTFLFGLLIDSFCTLLYATLVFLGLFDMAYTNAESNTTSPGWFVPGCAMVMLLSGRDAKRKIGMRREAMRTRKEQEQRGGEEKVGGGEEKDEVKKEEKQ